MENVIPVFALLILCNFAIDFGAVFGVQGLILSNGFHHNQSTWSKSAFSAHYRSPPALPFQHRPSRSTTECMEKADLSENTIIRTKDSRALGAKFINETSLGPGQQERCLVSCCLTPGCNVAVYDERNDGNCYLFDCGSPSDFRCKFTPHSHYTSAVWSNPVPVSDAALQLDLTEFRHEEELSQLKNSRDSSLLVPKVPATTTSTQATTAAKPNCSHYQFQCRFSGECIAIYNACNGIPQCADGSDEAPELGCPTTTTGVPTTTQRILIVPATKSAYSNNAEPRNNNKDEPWNRYDYDKKMAERPHHFPETESHHPIFKENYNPVPAGNPGTYSNNNDKNDWYVQGVGPDLLRSNANVPNTGSYDKNNPSYPYNSWGNNWDNHFHPKANQDPGFYENENESYRNGHGNGNYNPGSSVMYNYNNNDGPVAPPAARPHYNNFEQPNLPAFNADNRRPFPAHGRPDVAYEPAAYIHAETIPAKPRQDESSKVPLVVQAKSNPEQFTTLTTTPTTLLTSASSFVSVQTSPTAPAPVLVASAKKTHQAHAQIHKFHVSEADYQAEKQEQVRQTAGAIWALTLGLAVTAALIVLVGCRMRVLKRHLRRGRGAHREADFLVNGMYL